MNKIVHPIEPEELMAYLDGELTTDRADAIAAHHVDCADCQQIAAELRSVSQGLKAWKVDPSESTVSAAITTALAERRPQPRSVPPARSRSLREVLGLRWPVVAWVGVGTAAAILLVAAVSMPNLLRTRALPQQMRVKVSPYPPSAASINGREFDRLQQFSKLQSAPSARPEAKGQDQSAEPQALPASAPMIIRTAQLSLIAKEFDKARANLDAILKGHRGYVGELKVDGAAGGGRTLSATLRVPADQLDAALTEIKTLGLVESESQGGQDVTAQYVDLQARLSNARNTEQRLTDLLRNRTGKLSDVLEVETELDRVRGQIEQMEAERKSMANQVSYATLNATITEDYQARLQVVPPSTSTRLGNAAVEGYRNMSDGILDLALFLLTNGPSLLLWGAILFFPARLVWKKVRRSFAS